VILHKQFSPFGWLGWWLGTVPAGRHSSSWEGPSSAVPAVSTSRASRFHPIVLAVSTSRASRFHPAVPTVSTQSSQPFHPFEQVDCMHLLGWCILKIK